MKQLTLLSFFLFTCSAFACSCIGKSSVKSALKHTAVVFVGKVISREIYEYRDSLLPDYLFREAVYKLLVTEKIKGKIVNDTVSVYTGIGGGDCGMPFVVGENYIIYSRYEEEHFDNGIKMIPFLTTNICTRTQRFEEEEYRKLKRLAKRKKFLV